VTYTWATWLPDALRAEGCTVVTYDGWKNRGRPASTGEFDPYAALWHHTGTHSSKADPNPSLSVCINGRPDLAGPLCQVLIGYDGVCHVIAAGRANHAGTCNGAGPTKSGDGNAQMVGFEIDFDGSQQMSDVQYDAAIRAGAAVVKHYEHDQDYCLGHKETSTTGKWDPGGYSMDAMRKAVKDHLASGGGDDMPEYVSLSGPGFTLTPDADWTPVKMTTESADSGGIHPDGYAWLNLGGAKYMAQVRLNDCERETPDTTVVVRWAEYDKESGAFVSAPAPAEYPLTTGTTGIHDHCIDSCSKANRIRPEVKARSGRVTVGGVGLTALYWR